MTEMFEFIRDFEGDIPGATAINCGNYLDMDLKMAKLYSQKFLDDILYKIDEEHLNYPV
jgi:S-ribosylhomocysteine lyase